MSQPFIGEIRMAGFNFAPAGWATCDGQLVPISENDALFNLIGTTYGGDGQETFALPNLQGRVPVHQGNSYVLGELSGTEDVTLTVSQMPAHTHPMQATLDNATKSDPAGNIIARTGSFNLYLQGAPVQAMAATAVTSSGGSQPHDNMMPFLVVNFIIALFGIYPTPS